LEEIVCGQLIIPGHGTRCNWFKQAGATEASVSLVKDRDSGQPRGFAFVEINNDEEADRVIQSLNGQDFMGRNVVVNEARPREDEHTSELQSRENIVCRLLLE